MAASVRAVIWDFGGVLITPITHAIDDVASWHGTTMVDMLDVLMGPREQSTADHPWHRAERGELPIADMQAAVEPWARAAGISLRGDEYARLLRGDFDVRDAVIDRIGRLREEGYITAMLTNSFREFRPTLEERIDTSVFDVVVDSSEVGHRKPEPQIYDIATEMVGVDAGEVLYFDDFAANIDGAAAAGWQTVHVTGESHILSDLERILAGG